ncbi:MAG: hypothetical protein HWD61_04050 [Parachlamydiaceae bacterium]|nr:MAG: hypothetical protein HWD61_04050 [Parachlamydiaceae bacterium]
METVNGFPIDEMNSLNEYIRNYHSGSDNKFSIRALGKDWCVWFDGNANRVLVQEQERFDANQGEKIELLINHINVSIYAPSMDYKYLIRRIIEEVASMRLIREEPSTEQRQSPIRVNVNQTPHQEPISRVRETPVVYTYPETSHLRKNPTPMVNNGPKDLKLQLTHSEMHETRAQLFPDAKSADQPGKLSCAQDWNLFRNTLRDFIGAIKHSSFISKFAVCDLGELGIFNVYSEGDSKNQFICITKQGEESPYIRVKIDEFGFIETLFVNGEEHIAFESKSKSKKSHLKMIFLPMKLILLPLAGQCQVRFIRF